MSISTKNSISFSSIRSIMGNNSRPISLSHFYNSNPFLTLNNSISLGNLRGVSSKPLFQMFSPDIQSAALGIYSCRLINSNYTGPIFNLRRSSDNNIRDFYSDYNGNLADISGNTFVSWMSGTISVMIWYDQSGGTRHANATSASGGNPPQLVLDPQGSGKYVIYFPNNGATTSSYYGFTMTSQAVNTIMCNYYTLSNSSGYQYLLTTSNDNGNIRFFNSTTPGSTTNIQFSSVLGSISDYCNNTLSNTIYDGSYSSGRNMSYFTNTDGSWHTILISRSTGTTNMIHIGHVDVSINISNRSFYGYLSDMFTFSNNTGFKSIDNNQIGNFAFDSTATDNLNNYTLTITGATYITTGQKAGTGAISFTNGATPTQYANSTTHPTLTFANGISFSLWVRMSSLPATGARNFILCFQTTPTQAGISLHYYNNLNSITGFVLSVYTGTTWINTSFIITATTGTWYHLVGIISSTSAKLYVNTSSTSNITYSVTYSATKLSLAYDPRTTIEGLNGAIDNLQIWNRILSLNDIISIYMNNYLLSSSIDYQLFYKYNHIPIWTNGLVGSYIADDWDGTRWRDRSLSNNHAITITGASTIALTKSQDNFGLGGLNYLYGPSTSTITFPIGILPATYTLFHIARYNGTNRGRLITGPNTGTNWLSGFDTVGKSGVASHSGNITQNTISLHGDNWVLSTDQNSLYRSLSKDRTTGAPGTPSNVSGMGINIHSTFITDWAVACILVFNRTLNLLEYLAIEDYLASKYYINVPIQEGLIVSLDAADYISGNATWNDRTINNYSFTLTNTSAYNNGYFPYFNFQSQGAYLTNTTDIPYSDYNTLIVFTSIMRSNTTSRSLLSGNDAEQQVIINTGTNNLGYYVTSTNTFIPFDNNIDISTLDSVYDKCNMYVFRFNKTSPYIQCYYNAVSLPLNPVGTSTNINTLLKNGFRYIGYLSSSQYWGNIGTLLWYNRRLSDEEIVDIYNRYKNIYNLPQTVNYLYISDIYLSFNNTVNDSFSYLNNPVVTGTSAYVNGYFSNTKAYYLNNPSDGTNILNNKLAYQLKSSHVITTGTSISFWLNQTLTNASTGDSRIFGFINNTGGTLSYAYCAIKASTNYLTCGITSSDRTTLYGITTSYALTLNTWYHVVITYTSSKIILYINGNLINSTNSIAITDQVNYIMISSFDYNDTKLGFPGYIQNFRLYKRVLNPYEINMLYNVENNINDPLTVIEPILNFDASEIAKTVTVNSTITSWTNTGTWGIKYNATAFNSPILGINNNYYHVNFTRASSQYFAITQSIPMTWFNNSEMYNGMTFFIVAQYLGSPGDFERFLDFSSAYTTNVIAITRYLTNSTIIAPIYNSTTKLDSNIGLSYQEDGLFHIYIVKYVNSSTNGSIYIYRDSIIPTISSLNAPINNRTTTINYIGRSNVVSNAYLNANIRQILVFNSSLSDANINSIYQSLKTKYNL